MKILCPRPGCPSHSESSPKTRLVIRNGFFYRRSDRRRVRRYACRSCGNYFCCATISVHRYQKKKHLNRKIFELYSSGVSQRRLARLLKVNPKTIVRKIRIEARVERQNHRAFLDEHYKETPLSQIQFNDLETSEHTKCKPLSVSLAIDPRTRKILGFQVASMPAKGLIARISRKKYGLRKDNRPEAWDQLMRNLVPYVEQKSIFTSDENPHYSRPLKKHFPQAQHIQVKGGRGAITGQGELKKLKWDPLFSLNHTCAMLRANLNRLFRRTWCTTKNQQGLIDHLSLYVSYHNRILTSPTRS